LSTELKKNENKTNFTLDKGKLFKSLLPVLGILAGALVGSIVIALKGVSPIEAYAALLDGALGSVDNIATSLIKTIPLGFTGLAVILSYRAGIFNVGGEGQIQMAAVAATIVGTHFLGLPPVLHITLCLLAAAVAGGIMAILPGYMKAYKGFNEIVVTMLLNYIAIFMVSFLVQGPIKMKDQYFPQSAPLLASAKLPFVLPHSKLHIGIIFLLILSAILYFVIFKTTFGFKVRAVGLNPRAAQYGGIDSKKIMTVAFVLSGAIAGMAGGIEIMGVHGRLMENFSPGYGYDAIAVALLADLHPGWVLLSAFFFGALRNGANSMQIATGVPVSFVYIIQALAVLFVVGATGMPKFIKRMQMRRAKANA
jgi:ABC-type uncharacterized transport system permease subunit